MAEERGRYQEGVNTNKHNRLMNILAHKVPEFGSVLRAGAPISNETRDFFYKRVSGKRESLIRQVERLFGSLSGHTEARIRYNLFLRDNPNFPDLFKNHIQFFYHFSRGPESISPYDLYTLIYYEQDEEFAKEHPGEGRSSPARIKFKSDFNSTYELKYFNSILNALTNPLPADAEREIDIATNGQYSRNKAARAARAAADAAAAAAGGGGGAAAGGGGGYRGGARRSRKTRRRRSSKSSRGRSSKLRS
jgi:hypothetical protein